MGGREWEWIVALIFLCSWQSWAGNKIEASSVKIRYLLGNRSRWKARFLQAKLCPPNHNYPVDWQFHPMHEHYKYLVWQEGGFLVGQRERIAEKKALKVHKVSLWLPQEKMTSDRTRSWLLGIEPSRRVMLVRSNPRIRQKKCSKWWNQQYN